jgi:hypothetical protein
LEEQREKKKPLTGQNAQPGGGVLQEPEDDEAEDEPEDDGQEDSSEGAETAGPLTLFTHLN